MKNLANLERELGADLRSALSAVMPTLEDTAAPTGPHDEYPDALGAQPGAVVIVAGTERAGRSRWWLASAAAVAVLLSGGLAVIGSRSQPEPGTNAPTATPPTQTDDAAPTQDSDTIVDTTLLLQDSPSVGSELDEAKKYDLVLAVGYTEEESGLIDAAWRTVFDDCISQEGFEPRPFEAIEAESPEEALERRNFDDTDRIAAEGYHYLFESTPQAADPPATDETTETPSALPGSVEVACKTQANDRISAGTASGTADEFLDTATNDIRSEVAADPEFLRASSEWADCMAGRGYSYPSIDDAVPDMLAFASSDVITEQEITMALADSGCRQASGLRETELRLTENRNQTWIEDNAERLSELRDTIDLEVDAARQVFENAQ